MWDSQLVHSLMNRLRRLVKGFFEIGHMVFVAMMMGNVIMFMMGRGLVNVFQRSIDQRQHVLRCVRIEHPPIASDREIYG